MSRFNDKKEWRKFGFAAAVIMLAIGTIQIFTGKDLYRYFFAIGGIFAFFALVAPVILKPVFILFSYLGIVLGWIMTRVILTILFYLVFTPTGLILRLFGKNLLDMKIDRNTPSYWKKKDTDKGSYENQY